jgi:hypothetical protein
MALNKSSGNFFTRQGNSEQRQRPTSEAATEYVHMMPGNGATSGESSAAIINQILNAKRAGSGAGGETLRAAGSSASWLV